MADADVADHATYVVADADVADDATYVVADADVADYTTNVADDTTGGIDSTGGNGNETTVDYLSTITTFFKSPSESISIMLAGCEQFYVHKTFRSDPDNTPLKFYIDLEVHDKCGSLYNYIVLSAHFNTRLNRLAIGRAVVEDRRGQRFYVGCLLRTKCVHPRYDIMLLPLADGTMEQWFRLPGITKFRSDYQYIPLEFEDHDRVISSLSHWFKVQGFTYDPERGPNQDDSGSLVFEPDDLNLEPSRINKRKGAGRRTKASARNSLVVPKKVGVSCKKARATKKAHELTEKITSKKPKRSEVVKNVCFYASDILFNLSLLVQGRHHHEEVITIEDGGISPPPSPIHQQNGDILHPPPPLHQDAVVKELMQQLKESQAMNKEMRDEMMKQIVSIKEVAPSPIQQDPPAQPASIVGASEPPVPPTIPVVPCTTSLRACGVTGGPLVPHAVRFGNDHNSYMFMSAIQDQSERLHRLHDAEKKNVLYENLVLQNYFK